ncbi:MAG: EVE domain-containing protein [Gammaproteobacteria bacterium CG11_big_fil_rev_8_21_14_0_20_46_22]|nr:MAG: EVE domain-containing protein [Gammaproteobacteria bacterium CG12_big_fil_rev_8_21_14_0_65_46_12]PIR11500.1 MAG: EVE domain-containing protein [Gammaproteobacteria bacterium CG11_big_fil_rev_8_21_14_0_20_46_22]
MNYWLMKSEPDVFGIDDLKLMPKKTEHWDGVRNYQARNFMKSMKKGDLIFFYHSNCTPPGIVGIAEVVKEAYPDFTAWNPESKYFDPKSTEDNPRWFMVDVKFKEKFKTIISLDELKQSPALSNMRLVKKGNRLSVMPVEPDEWDVIIAMSPYTGYTSSPKSLRANDGERGNLAH